MAGYLPGSSAPVLPGGLFEIGGLRIHNGSLTTVGSSGFNDLPPVRQAFDALPYVNGEAAGSPFLAGRDLTIEGYCFGDDATDVLTILQLLRNECTIYRAGQAGLMLRHQFPDGRPMLQSRVHSPMLQVAEPSPGTRQRQGMREFQLQFHQADPRFYDVNQRQSNFGNQPFTVNGNFPAPWRITANGPFTSFNVTAAGKSFGVSGVTVGNGQTATFDTAARTVVRSDGANLYGGFTGQWFDLPPGPVTVNWTVGVSASLIFRDTWI